ncbi:sporulation protein [Litchfieldia alkalitelluris]|uniref:sporulation protein n=1 Tax=Litchfieldia alkalitelluris TaxID=304268 RepID=UPI000998A8E7|nr:sporulation protein [Litchfieldia alkalitelluris]
MILRKYMSLLGIGCAKVNLILEKKKFFPGEGIVGYFSIKGGTIEQLIKRIECDLIKVNCSKRSETIVDSVTIHTSRTIDCNEDNQVKFYFRLPDNISPSDTNISYHFKTRLIFEEGVKSVDQDSILILSCGQR